MGHVYDERGLEVVAEVEGAEGPGGVERSWGVVFGRTDDDVDVDGPASLEEPACVCAGAVEEDALFAA